MGSMGPMGSLRRALPVAVLLAAAGARSLLLWPAFEDPARRAETEAIVRRVRREAPDVFMGTEALAARAGFGLETHRVSTEDGFELQLHRLVAPGRAAAGEDRGDPVFMMHGIACASHLFMLTGPGHALAFLLAKRGYDVWLGNARGNVYSRRHRSLASTDLAYWNFSWHEMGVFDAPASIDYVLAATGRDKLFYIGHSMGNTLYFVMATQRPEYNAKVRLHVGLAPVVYIGQLRSPVARAVVPYTRGILKELELEHRPVLLPPSATRAAFLHLLCNRDPVGKSLCLQIMGITYGPVHPGLNTSQLSFYLAHAMQGASVRTAAHFVQNLISGRFRQWEEGTPEKNRARYGQPEPPDYDLSRATAPSALFYSDDDYVLHEQGVKRLARELPNVALLYRVPNRPFNHIDFLITRRAPELVYNAVFDAMAKH